MAEMSGKLDEYTERANQAEQQIELLIKELEGLKTGSGASNSSPPAQNPADEEEVTKLKAENARLKYRLSILKRAVDKETGGSGGQSAAKVKKPPVVETRSQEHMTNVSRMLVSLFQAGMHTAFPDLVDPPCPLLPSTRGGDYQFNGAMTISGLLKASGVKMAPRDIANKIVENIPTNDLIEKLEVAGPGFVNIFVRKEFIQEEIDLLVERGVRPPKSDSRKRVVVDFSSPNIAKEMHVGHLRSTIIGDSVCRLLEFLGHDVVRLNHIGDWGTQFGMLIAHLQDEFPNFVTESPPISDLMAFYKQSKARFDADEAFKARAYQCVVKLQAHEPEYIKAWNLICDVSRKEFQKVYDRLDVVIQERGESFYQDRMVKIVEELKKANHLEEDEGRKVMFGPGVDVPLTVVKSDGGYTYDTSDMAALKQRIEEEKADWIVYLTDAGQSTHFQIVFACAQKAGFYDPAKVRLDHVGFGVVLGEDKKKFKTRSGDTVRLVELLDEGLKRSLDKLKEKEREKVLSEEELKAAQESVAYGCIKYSDLCHNRNHEYVFSFDKMLEDRGNTAVYMLYAYTRIRSIARTAQVSDEQLAKIRKEKNLSVSLKHEKELKLGKLLLRLPEVIHRMTEDLLLHSLCEFMYEVANVFTEFYENCYCVEKNSSGEIVKVNYDRLLLCEATANVLASCFHILGLKPVQKM